MKTSSGLVVSYEYDTAANLKNGQGLSIFYDPEVMTFKQQEAALIAVYVALYPWHGTPEQISYDYPSFNEAVRVWAGDEFYQQHLTAKLYCETVDWIFQEPINAWQYEQ